MSIDLAVVKRYFTNPWYYVALLLILFVTPCSFVFKNIQIHNVQKRYERDLGRDIEIEGIIIRPIKYSHEYADIYIKDTVGKGIFLVRGERFGDYNVGDICRVVVRLKELSSDNYGRYLKAKGVYLSSFTKSIECKRSNSFTSTLFQFKKHTLDILNRDLREPYSSFLYGFLWGDDMSFDKSLEKAFVLTGTTHIIAASGFNVNFVSKLFEKVFFFLTRRVRNVVIIMIVSIYCLLCGLSPSICRATIQFGISKLFESLGVPININFTFIYTMMVMIIPNPYILFDMSFQLSVMATMGIVYLSKIVKQLSIVPISWVETISANITTAPVILLAFGRVSLISVPINSLILGMVEPLYLFTVVYVGVASIWPSLSAFIPPILSFLASGLISIIRLGAIII